MGLLLASANQEERDGQGMRHVWGGEQKCIEGFLGKTLAKRAA
jgi:hypothetical protein